MTLPYLPNEIWHQISMDNPTTYYRLVRTSKMFIQDTDTMKAKFIKHIKLDDITLSRLPNSWLHSCNDQPAEIRTPGDQYWYNNGKLHRDNDKPAAILINGTRYWYTNGKQHRDNDRPAIILACGDQYWYINGEPRRSSDIS